MTTATPATSPVLVRLQTLRQRDPRVFWGALGAIVVIVALLIAILVSQHQTDPLSAFDPTTQKVIALVESTCSDKVDLTTVTVRQYQDGSYEWVMNSAADGHQMASSGSPTNLGSSLKMVVLCTLK